MKSDEVLKALSYRHEDPREWIFIEEAPVGTGSLATNRIDAYAISCWPSAQNKRIAYEVKVSRADFMNEKKNPAKRRPAMLLSNQFYFATPKGLLKVEEIPVDCGLIEATDAWTSRIVLEAPYRDSIRPTWNYVAALLRNLCRPHALRKKLEDFQERESKRKKNIAAQEHL